MSNPLFEICCIGKNEFKTIPRLNDSLREYKERGGIVNYLDTGSKDGTQDLARSFGWRVKDVGEKFLIEIENYEEINKKFVVDGEEPIVKKGDKYFNFSAARNECAEMATQPVIFWYDCDEVAERLDIDYVNDIIQKGFTQFEYFFCFAKDSFGNEAVKFIQCKAYDKTVMLWRGRIHELVCNIDNSKTANRVFIPEDRYKLAHYQNHEQGRHSYMGGLAIDCYEFPENDRHKFYLNREMLYHGRLRSALRGFKQHLRMGGWHSERSESLIYCGDIYGMLQDPTNQMLSYAEAFHLDSGRNAALVKLALFYRHNGNHQAAIAYAKAALEIPYNGFYADNLANYREIPHEILYQSLGRCPNIPDYVEKAKQHLLMALSYQPLNAQYLADTKFYWEYPDNGIEGWMKFDELQFLYETSKKMTSVIEVGSWCGRSSHAILSGCKGDVTCVDSWKGSDDIRDYTNSLAKERDIFEIFKKNVGHFPKLKIIKERSVEAAATVPDRSAEMVFLDAGHDFQSVVADIRAWRGKATKILCGHDWLDPTWMGVISAVRQELGEPDEIHGTIWVKYLN